MTPCQKLLARVSSLHPTSFSMIFTLVLYRLLPPQHCQIDLKIKNISEAEGYIDIYAYAYYMNGTSGP